MNEKKKATLRIPTKEQYAYIEIEIEDTPGNIVDAYLAITHLYKSKAEQWAKDAPPF